MDVLIALSDYLSNLVVFFGITRQANMHLVDIGMIRDYLEAKAELHQP